MLNSLTAFLVNLFWTPKPIENTFDFLLVFISLVPICLLVWYLFAILIRFLILDPGGPLGAYLTIRLTWAWAALAVGIVMVVDLFAMSIWGRPADWKAVVPHFVALLAFLIFALVTGLIVRSERRRMQKILFDAVPKSSLA